MEDLLEEGIRSFNAGHYFEAHERWEDLWRQTHGPLRLFYQGLIQAAVGLHHLNRGNRNGARAQIGKAIQKLEQYPALYSGIHNAQLIANLRQSLDDSQPHNVQIKRT